MDDDDGVESEEVEGQEMIGTNGGGEAVSVSDEIRKRDETRQSLIRLAMVLKRVARRERGPTVQV